MKNRRATLAARRFNWSASNRFGARAEALTTDLEPKLVPRRV
jgi:hypothetical protein